MDFAKVQILGHVGGDPKVIPENRGDSDPTMASFSVATNHGYKGNDGEWHEQTSWHRVVVKNPYLVKMVDDQVRKGAQVQLFGHLESRTFEKEGEQKFITEVVLAGPDAQLIVHQGRGRTKEAEGQWTEKEQQREKTSRKQRATAVA